MALQVLHFVKAEWVKPLWKQIEWINGERAKELNRLRDEFIAPETLKDGYVMPYLQDRNPADSRRDDLLSAARQPAFERINEFFQGGLPLEKDGRHQMFILADAGMGKTSLLLMIKLMHLTSFWPKGHNCALFKLGENTLERVQALPNKSNTILLLDALDQDTQAYKRIRDRLLELLRASEDFRRVLISSRTQFFPEMEPDRFGRPEINVLSGYHCPVLYLSPFTDAQVHEFLEKRMPLTLKHRLCFQVSKIRQQRQKAAHLIEQMQDLRMRPMLLQHLDKLLEVENSQQEWNAYTVYEALINEWLDREVRKLRAQHDIQARVPDRKELLWACVLVAEWMQRQGTRVIAEEELQQLILADLNIAWLVKFELGGRSLLNRNSERAFRFSHYTIQEFLCAYGMVNNIFTSKERVQVTDQLLRFINLAGGRLSDYQHFFKASTELDTFSIASNMLANCTIAEDIAALCEQLDWLSSSLRAKADDHLYACLELSQDVKSALEASSFFRQEQRLEQVCQKIVRLDRELTATPSHEATVICRVLDNWLSILKTTCRILREQERYLTEIPQVYLPGPPLEPDKAGSLFKGRRDLFRQIESLLLSAQPPTLVMHGGRRSGKSSALLQLPKQMPSDILPLFVDCQGAATSVTLEGLARHLVEQLLASAKTTCRLTLPVPDKDELASDPFAALLAWLDAVEQAAPGKIFLLCLDEFERIDEIVMATESRAPLNFLRHLIQHRDRWLLLFAGAHTPDELAPHWSDCLINTRSLRVSCLDKDDALDLICRPVPDFPEIWPDAAVEEVWRLTQGQPYLVQLLCSEAVDHLNRNKAKLVQPGDVAAILPAAFEHGYYYFDEFWRALGEDQRTLLAALAKGEAVPPELYAAMAVLLRKEVLVQEQGGHAFKVPLIQEWIAARG